MGAKLASVCIIAILTEPPLSVAAEPCDLPAWSGTVIIDCESINAWQVEAHGGSSGELSVVPGFVGQAVRLDYQLGTGFEPWVQAKYPTDGFDPPLDLSGIDLLGICLRGSTPVQGVTNRLRLMVEDTNGVFYEVVVGCIAHVDRWLINMPVPKSLFQRVWWSPAGPISWAQIKHFFVAVVPPPPECGAPMSAGSVRIDHIQIVRSAGWEPLDRFVTIAPDASAAAAAVQCVLNRQCPTGLFQSWEGDADVSAWLYDQALALLMLTREGLWVAADPLAGFMVAEQRPDGHWARGWDCSTGAELLDDEWVGDQAWMTYALHRYGTARPDQKALTAAELAGDWLLGRMDPNGMVSAWPQDHPSDPIVYSTEGNFDTWAALMQLGRIDEADLIANHLHTTYWDIDMRYWKRGVIKVPGEPIIQDSAVALNANAWPAAGFALHSRVRRPDMALDALQFVRRTLATQSDDGTVCGLDFEGPVSVHCEGLGSYVVARGPESQQYVDILKSLQDPNDGCVPGSPDDWRTDAWWLTSWTGIAPTAWLYFALTGSPFDVDCNRNSIPDDQDVADGSSEDVNGNGVPDECECPSPGTSGEYCEADIYPNNGDGRWDDYDDGDCTVDLSDLFQLLANYRCTGGCTREDGDIYPPHVGDGDVGLNDLAELLGQYGDDCR